MSKCLVTGGAGFIGSNLVDKLIDLGHEVIVIDNESSTSNDMPYWNDKAKNYKYDICDYEKTRKLYNGIEYVFHMAAETRIKETIDNPIKASKTNFLGTNIVLECSKEANVKRVIYSSTASGYGNNPVPSIETQPDDCLNPYSVSKIAGEKLCKMYYDLFGLENIILRYFNVYGNRQPSKGLIVGIFERQFKNKEKLTIMGDGSQKRDFVHVDDVVLANILSAEININSKYFGNVFNIGNGKNYSVKDIALMFDTEIEMFPEKDGGQQEMLANIEKAKNILGWYPKVDFKKYIEEIAR